MCHFKVRSTEESEISRYARNDKMCGNDKKIKNGKKEPVPNDKNMQKEIDYRKTVVRADLHEKIMAAKELGDFSENSELHETRRAKGEMNQE